MLDFLWGGFFAFVFSCRKLDKSRCYTWSDRLLAPFILSRWLFRLYRYAPNIFGKVSNAWNFLAIWTKTQPRLPDRASDSPWVYLVFMGVDFCSHVFKIPTLVLSARPAQQQGWAVNCVRTPMYEYSQVKRNPAVEVSVQMCTEIIVQIRIETCVKTCARRFS